MAYTKFDPNAFLESEIRGGTPAKVAKVAKVEADTPQTLAGLAGLAGAPLQNAIFGQSALGPLAVALAALERRCPELVPTERWQQAVEDGRRFLAQWGQQAEALGWTPKEIFGLVAVPANPHPSFSRLSRYDEIGLVWILARGRVLALTADSATISTDCGSRLRYYKNVVWLGMKINAVRLETPEV
jgi:hypothetical protein